MRLIIAGKNNIAVDVLKYALDNFNVSISIVLNKSEDFKNGFQKSLGFYAKLWKVPIVSLEDVYSYNDAIFLSLEFDRIIKPNFFKTDLLFNIHFSLLPKYKGMYTSAIPLLQGEKKSGVTLHLIDTGIDTGDIIAQKEFEIRENDTSRSLYSKYIEYGTNLITENLDNLLRNEFKSFPQLSRESTYYDKNSIDYKNLKINYKKTAFQVVNQLRAFSFREYQLPKFQNVEIGSWKITNEKSFLNPGSVVKVLKNGFQIATIDFDIIINIDMYDKLWDYCKKNDFNSLHSLLEEFNLDLEKKTKQGWTALIIAAYNNSFESVKYLIQFGSNVNAQNYNHTSVLMYAKTNTLRTKDRRVLDCLLENGADLNLQDIYGKTVKDWVKEEDNELYEYFTKKKWLNS